MAEDGEWAALHLYFYGQRLQQHVSCRAADGKGLYNVCHLRHIDRLPGPFRTGDLCRRAADEGDRGSQGAGRESHRYRGFAEQGLYEASADLRVDSVSPGLVGNEPVAAEFRVSHRAEL